MTLYSFIIVLTSFIAIGSIWIIFLIIFNEIDYRINHRYKKTMGFGEYFLYKIKKLKDEHRKE